MQSTESMPPDDVAASSTSATTPSTSHWWMRHEKIFFTALGAAAGFCVAGLLIALQMWLIPGLDAWSSARSYLFWFILAPSLCFAGAAVARRQGSRFPRPIACGIAVAAFGHLFSWWSMWFSFEFMRDYVYLIGFAWWIGVGALAALFVWIFSLPMRRSRSTETIATNSSSSQRSVSEEAPAPDMPSTNAVDASFLKRWKFPVFLVVAAGGAATWYFFDYRRSNNWSYIALFGGFLPGFLSAVIVCALRLQFARRRSCTERNQSPAEHSTIWDLVLPAALGAGAGALLPVLCLAVLGVGGLEAGICLVVACPVLSIIGAGTACALW